MSVGITTPNTQPTDEERHLPDPPLIAHEDLQKLGVDSERIPLLVSTITQAERSPNGLPTLSPAEAKNVVEILDKVVSSATNPSLKGRRFRVLRDVSSTHGVLPTSHHIFEVELTDTTALPHASGGFADIWKGQWCGSRVCVKAFRIETTADPDKIRRKLYREIAGWKSVSHQHVLSFLGVSETLFPFCIISPWLPNGDIGEYTKRERGANRLRLLAQVASGLGYLHSLSIVHSNITPGNILITEEGDARLGNIGITGSITDPTGTGLNSMTTSEPAAVRYMAPELLDPSQARATRSNPPKESDIYSLAMTAYEILSDVLPYGERRESAIAFQIVSGERPPRPSNPTANCWLLDPIWGVIQSCWHQTPQSRLSVDLLHQAFFGSETEQVRDGADTPEEENPTQSVRPSPEPPSERPGSSVQPPPVKNGPFETILAGILRAVGFVFCRGGR